MWQRKSRDHVLGVETADCLKNLSKKKEEIRVVIVDKDVEILKLKLKNQKNSFEGLGITEALNTKNADLTKKVSVLIDEVQSLNTEVKNLSKQLLDSHTAESARIEILLSTLSPKLRST